MRACRGQAFIAAVAGLILLSGCETSTKLGDLMGSGSPDDQRTTASIPDSANGLADTTGSVGTGPVGTGSDAPNASGLLGSDPYDDLNMGKKFYRSANYGLAERHFRRVVEARPRDGEAWVGLAASYDQLRRFELADRAYNQAIAIVGPTPEVLNNKGYSYMLRGDYARARTTLRQAQAKDPDNPYIQNNLEMLEKSMRKGKGIEQK
jgi:tetratricopeptide (TPR) repeat protein